jgi:uncharacterized protein (UPF0332 family)
MDKNDNNDEQGQMYTQFLKQCFTLWINPEIEKRKKEGKISDKFIIVRAQILLPLGSPAIVRLNNEVKAVVKAKINKKIEKDQLLYESDVESIEEISLTDEEKDFGHATFILFKGHWILSFSFIYDKTKSQSFNKIGQQYLQSATYDLKNKNYRPFIESLSVSAENFAKARLYLLPDLEVRKLKKHSSLARKVCFYAKTSNIISSDFKDSFNSLLKLRDKARYNPDFSIKVREARALHEAVDNFKKEVLNLLSTA